MGRDVVWLTSRGKIEVQPEIACNTHRRGPTRRYVTKPRCVLPGTLYLVTRRCSERRFFLRPDPIVRQIFEYLLGMLAKAYAIEVHAYVVMSNHYHLVVTDTGARLPDFLRDLNSLLARSINLTRGRSDGFWEKKSYSGVKLVEAPDVLRSMAYTLANPVKARLVNRARQWGGATSAGMRFGRARTIRRPKGFFSDAMPETVELVLTRPGCLDGRSDDEVLEWLEADVARREALHHREGKAKGMQRVMDQDWRSSPETVEAGRQLQPTIKAADKWARIEALQRTKEWLRSYYEALARFVGGERDVEFPPGTWRMCVRLNCPIA